jgi:hypothetical protein
MHAWPEYEKTPSNQTPTEEPGKATQKTAG